MDEALKNQEIEITQNAASRLKNIIANEEAGSKGCLLYTSPSPRDS